MSAANLSTPGHPQRRWSGLYELRFNGEVVGQTRNLALACIVARDLGRGSVVEGISDGSFPSFGCHYSPSPRDLANWPGSVASIEDAKQKLAEA